MPAPIPHDPNFQPTMPQPMPMTKGPATLYTAGGELVQTTDDGNTLILKSPCDVCNIKKED